MPVPQSKELILHLHIESPWMREAFQEILPQACISWASEEKECAGVLTTSSSLDTLLPFLNLSTLPKPLRFIDLLTLLNNLQYTRIIEFSYFLLDTREKNLKNLKSSQDHRLTGKECQLLRFFYQNIDQQISKERLLKEIWEYHPETTTHTLETHVYRLRQKLEDNPASPQFLLNCKDGYLFKIGS